MRRWLGEFLWGNMRVNHVYTISQDFGDLETCLYDIKAGFTLAMDDPVRFPGFLSEKLAANDDRQIRSAKHDGLTSSEFWVALTSAFSKRDFCSREAKAS